MSNGWHLFLDESGDFKETDPDPKVRSAQGFPSQLAGLLAPADALTEADALKVLQAVHAAAGLPLRDEVHGSELAVTAGARYDDLILALLREVRARGWQPIRLVNREKVSFGDRAATYTNLVAELALRVFERKQRERRGEVDLRLTCAVVVPGRDEADDPVFLDAADYQRRLTERVTFTAIRHGHAQASSGWRVRDVRLGSARKWRELQLCDLLSHASHGGGKTRSAAVRSALKEAFGDWDFTLALREVAARVDEHLADGSLGLALREVAERLTAEDGGGAVAPELAPRAAKALDRLAALEAPWRNAQLTVLTAWLEQLIEQSRLPVTGQRAATWLLKQADALRTRLGGADGTTIDWFAFAVNRLALTAANHLGLLTDARRAFEALDTLLPAVAGQWEHASILMEGLIAQAVHLNDCCAPDEAAARMAPVAKYYEDLSCLMHEALPAVFPERVRSELCGKALGTWLQSEILAAMRDPTRVERARAISERAIAEFTAPSDVNRQFQYRCQLETVAGQYAAAREFLGKALDAPDVSHAGLARLIAALPERAQGFPLLHWVRLGATCMVDERADAGERTAFVEALRDSGLLRSPWCEKPGMGYPAHGLRRLLARTHGAEGRGDDALGAIHRLRDLDPLASNQLALALILAAALAEVAALTAASSPHNARKLLDHPEPPRLGVRQVIAAIQVSPIGESAAESWHPVLEQVLEDPTPARWQALLRHALTIEA
jgi:hypothetical protein